MNVAEAIPYTNSKEMKNIVKAELKKKRYIEVWDKQKLIYSAKKWRKENER